MFGGDDTSNVQNATLCSGAIDLMARVSYLIKELIKHFKEGSEIRKIAGDKHIDRLLIELHTMKTATVV